MEVAKATVQLLQSKLSHKEREFNQFVTEAEKKRDSVIRENSILLVQSEESKQEKDRLEKLNAAHSDRYLRMMQMPLAQLQSHATDLITLNSDDLTATGQKLGRVSYKIVYGGTYQGNAAVGGML